MKLIVAFALFVAAASAMAPVLHENSETAIPDEFIVVFKQISKALRNAHIARVKAMLPAGLQFRRFEIGKLSGYSTTLVNGTLAKVRAMSEVQYVEANQVVQAYQACATQTATPSWGLDRFAEQQINLDGVYEYPSSAGSGVDAYIIDTGIYTAHADFGGRAVWGTNTVDTQNTDCNGHGTHVAGTVGGTTFGVAKKTALIAVKVLNCAGSGTTAGVIQGIDWTAQQHQKSGKKTAVANMSLGGGKSTTMNAAVAAAVAGGVVMVVAAGNSNTDACNTSPASEPTSICVGATDVGASGVNQVDIRSYFSNYGTCVHVFAPGSDITSAWIPPATQNTISGTSMASPHMCGIAALFVGDDPSLNTAAVKTAVLGAATAGVIDLQCTTTACRNSPNLLGFNTC